MFYLYDGSFDGFLCCVYAHYYQESADGIRIQGGEQMQLFYEKEVTTDYNISHRVFRGLQGRLGQEICEKIFRAFLSDLSGKEMMVLRYIAVCLKQGCEMDAYRTHPDILAVQRASERVAREAHRFLGWMRFSDIQGVLYAAYEPDADLTCFIMPHFVDRLRQERFILHDRKRKKAGIYAKGYWEERPFDRDLRMYRSAKEIMTEEAWQTYFDHIAIAERENRALQRQFMPVKIWKNLTEKPARR